MSLAKPLFFTGAALLVLSLFSKAQTLGKLIFYPGKVSDIALWPSVTMSIQIIVQNTNSSGLRLNSFAGALYAKSGDSSILIGNVSTFQPVIIAGNSQGLITVQVKLFALSIVNDVIRAFQQNNFSQQLDLEANANVDNLQVPVNMTFNVGL